jgi:hypothetical protein
MPICSNYWVFRCVRPAREPLFYCLTRSKVYIWLWIITMSRLLARILLLAALFKTLAAAPGEFTSANGRYSVQLTSSSPGELLVAVFQRTNEIKTLSWSKRINWQVPNPGSIGMTQWLKALVTDAGNTVILRDWGAPQEKNGVRIIGRDKTADHELHPYDRTELTGAQPRVPERENRPLYPNYPKLRNGVSYYHIAALLDFVIEEEDSYAIWFGQTDQWLLLSLKDFNETIVKDEKQIVRLNNLARDIAERRVLEHQPSPVRRAIRVVQGEVAKIFPSLRQSQQRIWMTADTTPAYLFLAARKQSSDKKFVENLIALKSPGPQQAQSVGGNPIRFTLIPMGSEKVLGDFLLARWNGITNRESFSMETHILVPDEPLTYLGLIRTTLQLPIGIPDKAGIIWTYLIPARLAPGKWVNNSEVIPSSLQLSDVAPPFRTGQYGDKSEPQDIAIVFKGIEPGEYRLKFIWERHPTTSMWRTNMYTAVPGDYESLESKPFLLKAGETIQDLSVICTNRIGDPKAYEEDDRLRKPAPKSN